MKGGPLFCVVHPFHGFKVPPRQLCAIRRFHFKRLIAKTFPLIGRFTLETCRKSGREGRAD